MTPRLINNEYMFSITALAFFGSSFKRCCDEWVNRYRLPRGGIGTSRYLLWTFYDRRSGVSQGAGACGFQFKPYMSRPSLAWVTLDDTRKLPASTKRSCGLQLPNIVFPSFLYTAWAFQFGSLSAFAMQCRKWLAQSK
jgi:hypothetical protein